MDGVILVRHDGGRKKYAFAVPEALAAHCHRGDELLVETRYGLRIARAETDAPARLTDEVIAKIESKILQWAAEHQEPKYPTWREWQQANFPNNSSPIHPCAFIRRSDAYCTDYIGRNSCYDCSNQHIPADVAMKLGIEPKEN